MEQIETFLTEPWFQIDQQFSLVDILPFAVMLALLILSIAGYLRQKGRFSPAAPPKSAFEKLKSLGAAMIINPLGQVMLSGLAGAYLVLFVLALIATFILLATVIGWIDGPDGMEEARSSLGLGALLAVFLGAPFLIWRTIVAQQTMEETQKQTALQDDALFNDKINAAAKDLAATRQVTRVIGSGKEKRVLTEWQDDLVTRAAAIDRLQGLAVEAIKREDFPAAQRIARMLSIYVQELSREYPAKPAPETGNQKKLQEWFKSLRPIRRPDMERAVRALGRINPTDDKLREEFDPSNIDLRRCNLQGFDLRFLNFSGACFGNADMQGAYLHRVDLKGAILVQTKLQAALLHDVDLRNGTLLAAWLQGVTVNRACLQGANLQRAKLQGAYLGSVHISGQTILFDADLTGAAVQHTDDSQTGKLTQWHSRLYADNTFQTQSEETVRHWAVVFLKTGESVYVDPNSPFANAWRAWAAKAHPDVTIAPDWRADPGAD